MRRLPVAIALQVMSADYSQIKTKQDLRQSKLNSTESQELAILDDSNSFICCIVSKYYWKNLQKI